MRPTRHKELSFKNSKSSEIDNVLSVLKIERDPVFIEAVKAMLEGDESVVDVFASLAEKYNASPDVMNEAIELSKVLREVSES